MPEHAFVARERELAQLKTFLDRALAGDSQVCFVTGEAGAGKTALVTEFARRAQAEHDDLLVAMGDCNAQTGIGDPYLPFREILRQLTGDISTASTTAENASRLQNFFTVSGEAIVELGPDLLDVFVPGSGLIAQAASMVAGSVGWVDRLRQLTERKVTSSEDAGLEQHHIFEQYTDVLRALAAQQPLVLVVDDLQWTDADSASLLFHLGRSIRESRILVIGVYRPEDVAFGRDAPSAGTGRAKRHPLEPVLNELKRYYGDVWIDLDQAEAGGRQFVEALLDSESNRLGEDFREALYLHTKGHPLLTVELLAAMRERGDLIQDDAGYWVGGATLDWDTLPAKVEGVIEVRIGRLGAELQQILIVASVEGEHFTAEVVARVQVVDEQGVVRQLSSVLDKQHRLVNARGVRRIGTERLSLYQFQHHVFQKYLYSHLDEIERVYLHEDVGNALEALYGDQANEIAVQLARHYLQAEVWGKALAYHIEAGRRAANSYAFDQALNFYRTARGLAERLDDQAALATILIETGCIYFLNRSDEAIEQLQRGLAVGQGLLDRTQQARAVHSLAKLFELRGDFDAALDHLLTCEHFLETTPADELSHDIVRVYDMIAWLHRRRSNYQQALDHAQRGIKIVRQRTLNPELEYMAVGLLEKTLGMINWSLGKPRSALKHLEHSLSIWRQAELAHYMSEVYMGDIHLNMGTILYHVGDFDVALDHLERAQHYYHRVGDFHGVALFHNNAGLVRYARGEYRRALASFQDALRLCEEVGSRWYQPETYSMLALCYLAIGHSGEAMSSALHALEIARELESQTYRGFAHRALGEVYAVAEGSQAQAVEHFERSIALLEDAGADFDLALSCRAYGRMLHRWGRVEEGDEYLHKAREIFVALECGPAWHDSDY